MPNEEIRLHNIKKVKLSHSRQRLSKHQYAASDGFLTIVEKINRIFYKANKITGKRAHL